MRDVIIETSNIRRIQNALRAAMHAPRDVRIVVVSGPVGLGKTTSLARICATEDAIRVSARQEWSPGWCARTLAFELGCEEHRWFRENFENIRNALRVYPRAVLIDEADRLCARPNLIETLRDLHDSTGSALVLIGMRDLPRVVRSLPQVESRTSAFVEVQPLDLKDVRLMCEGLAEIELSGDLIEELHQASGGSARSLCLALERCETFAKRRGKQRIALSDLPDDFLTAGSRRARQTSEPAAAKPPLREVIHAA